MPVQDKYKKHELRDHIYEIPDTYIGSVSLTQLKTYVYSDESNRMIEKDIEYVPGLFKLYDEILVNALDQNARLKVKQEPDVKLLKNIRINVDKSTGMIEVMNDGDGIDVVQQTQYNNVWVPELIFGELLTSTNYDQNEEKLWGGKNGYGAKLANIFSKEFIVETVDHRNGLSYKQRFYDNMKSRDKAKVVSSKKAPFTRITFLPDYERFGLKGLTSDMYDLFRKRAFDACATTDVGISVYFNDVKIDIKDFEKYADLFLGSKADRPRAYETCGNDRWSVVASYSESNQFEQVSFVNGINTLRGGKHVEHIMNMIVKKLIEMVKTKKKKDVKPQHIRENLFLLIKSTIVNPSFDSQTKETLTTQASKFGSTCDISDKFITALYKTGIIDKAVSLTDFHEQKKVVKTDGKKTVRVLIPKLDDANKAGTKDSADCTLILTEGDSAKSMAIAGLSVIGRDKYGVFPLRGKIMNVKDASPTKISENEEITSLKKILGLEQGRVYKDISSLRYGKIMIMTDQDHDGSHIKGLLFNVFQSIWPSLYKTPSFLTSMLTPIIKVRHSTTSEVIEFYNMTDFETWKAKIDKTPMGLKPWKLKYYKGLGTSTPEEAKDYFRNMKKTIYVHTKNSDDRIDLAFNKKRADDRKKWLMSYDRNIVLDYTSGDVTYEDFVDKELIHFSNRDLERSIPSMVDGFKESTRKIYYGCQKRKLYTKEIKVAQLSGYISEVSAYHHGETSLQQAIIGMAQNYVGANNINVLEPAGQFGTRIKGGSDAASPRYIFTKLNDLAKRLFNIDDSSVLKRLNDDGMMIEHEYYIPVIPMILVNGGIGIGTGFSTNIPNHNPTDIIRQCRKITAVINKDAIDEMNKEIDKVTLEPITPWYLGFKGTITPEKEGTYKSRGVYTWLNDETLEITELPIGTWTDDYKEFLVSLLQNNSPVLKDFESHYTDKSVRFVLKFYSDVRAGVEMNLETEFKLSSTKNLNMNNIHLYNEKGAIQKYKDTTEIIKAWSKVRLQKYSERKAFLLNKLDIKNRLINAKVRFIQEIVSGTLNIMNKKSKVLDTELAEKGYPMFSEKQEKAQEIEVEDDALVEQGDENGAVGIVNVTASYAYLTKMPIHHLTYEKKQALENEAAAIEMEINKLKAKTLASMWNEELDALEIAWNEHKTAIEENLQGKNEGNGNVTAPVKKRAPPKKKA